MQGLEIRDEIRELFRTEVADDAEGHHGDFLLQSLVDVFLNQLMQHASSVACSHNFGNFEVTTRQTTMRHQLTRIENFPLDVFHLQNDCCRGLEPFSIEGRFTKEPGRISTSRSQV